MPIAAAVIGGAAVLGGAAISSNASRRATNAAQDATAQNLALQRETLARAEQYQQPGIQARDTALQAIYRQMGLPTGTNALASYGGGEGADPADPWASWQPNYGPAAAARPDMAARPNASAFAPTTYTRPAYQPAAGYLPPQAPAITARQPATSGAAGQSARPGEIATLEEFRAAQASGDPAAMELFQQRNPGFNPQQAQQVADSWQASASAPMTGAGQGAPNALAPYQGPSYASTMVPGAGGFAAPSAGTAPSYGARPAIENFQHAARPGVAGFEAPTRATDAALDLSLGRYQQSPDYQFQLDQGNRNILAGLSGGVGIRSGAAMRALQEYGQNLALGDYRDWATAETGRSQFDRTRADTQYGQDLGAGLSAWGTQQGLTQAGYTDDARIRSGDWQAQLGANTAITTTGMNNQTQLQATGMNNATTLGVANIGAASDRYRTDVGADTQRYGINVGATTDRERLASEDWYRQNQLQQSAYQFDANLGADMYRFNTGLDADMYRFGTGLDADMSRFNTSLGADLYRYDTTRGDQNYAFDATRADRAYEFDTALSTDAYNRYMSNLYGLVGTGQGAANALTGAGQSYAGAVGAQNNALAGAVGNSAIANANTITGLLGSGANALALYSGMQRPGSTYTPSNQVPGFYDWALRGG